MVEKDLQNPGILKLSEHRVRLFSNREIINPLRNYITGYAVVNAATKKAKKVEDRDKVSIRVNQGTFVKEIEKQINQVKNEKEREKLRQKTTNLLQDAQVEWIGLWFETSRTIDAAHTLPNNPDLPLSDVWNYLRLPRNRIGVEGDFGTIVQEAAFEITWDKGTKRYRFLVNPQEQEEDKERKYYRPVLPDGLPDLNPETRNPVPWEVHPTKGDNTPNSSGEYQFDWGDVQLPPTPAEQEFPQGQNHPENPEEDSGEDDAFESFNHPQEAGEDQEEHHQNQPQEGQEEANNAGQGDPEDNQDHPNDNENELENNPDLGANGGNPGGEPEGDPDGDAFVEQEEQPENMAHSWHLKDFPEISPSETDVADFIQRFKTALVLNKVEIGQSKNIIDLDTAEKKRDYTKKCLAGVSEAYSILRNRSKQGVGHWLDIQPNPGAVMPNPNTDYESIIDGWNALMEAMIQRWAPEERSRTGQQLQWKQMHRADSEKWSEYLERLRNCATYAGKTDDEVLERIKLEVDELTDLIIRNTKTVEECRQQLAAKEARSKINQSAGVSTFMMAQTPQTTYQPQDQMKQIQEMFETLNFASGSGTGMRDTTSFEGKCYFCGLNGHRVKDCMLRKKIIDRGGNAGRRPAKFGGRFQKRGPWKGKDWKGKKQGKEWKSKEDWKGKNKPRGEWQNNGQAGGNGKFRKGGPYKGKRWEKANVAQGGQPGPNHQGQETSSQQEN